MNHLYWSVIATFFVCIVFFFLRQLEECDRAMESVCV